MEDHIICKSKVINGFLFYRLNARQEKFPLATSYYEKVLDLTKRRYGNEAIQLIPVYQGLGRISFNSFSLL